MPSGGLRWTKSAVVQVMTFSRAVRPSGRPARPGRPDASSLARCRLALLLPRRGPDLPDRRGRHPAGLRLQRGLGRGPQAGPRARPAALPARPASLRPARGGVAVAELRSARDRGRPPRRARRRRPAEELRSLHRRAGRRHAASPYSDIGVRAEYAPASRSSMRVGPVGVQPRSSRVAVLVAVRSMPKKVPIHPK